MLDLQAISLIAMDFAQAVFLLVTSLLSAAALFLLTQILLSLKAPKDQFSTLRERPRIAILVPAHNESTGMLPTLEEAQLQMRPGDRLVVVADNCSDDTAAVAISQGAEVAERFNTIQRGKGFALDYGIRYLESAPPEVVIVLDADCTLGPDCIFQIASLAHATQRPVQARYLMKAPQDGLKMKVAEFAMRVKNWVRPRGMTSLGLPCGLYGTGMAFPWSVAIRAPFASGHLAEDMQLGVRLADIGAAPLFCESAHVNSFLAGNSEGGQSQRTRWEHGHLSLLFNEGPRLLASAIKRRRWEQALQVVDMLVPPLALLAILQCLNAAIGAGVWLIGGWAVHLVVGLVGIACLAVAGLVARAAFASDVLTLKELLAVPLYVVGKLSVYTGFVVRRQVEWIRTKRDEKP